MNSSVVVVNNARNPGCLIQVLWFIFIGWWVGQLWIAAAWVLMLTIIGIPISIMMLNAVPKVIALRGENAPMLVTTQGGQTIVSALPVSQVPLVLRIIYFILIGWWFSAIWLEVAYFLCAILIGMPLGFWMFDKTAAVLTLRR